MVTQVNFLQIFRLIRRVVIATTCMHLMEKFILL